jgi:tetratricopeptide (TPR) repeat protein
MRECAVYETGVSAAMTMPTVGDRERLSAQVAGCIEAGDIRRAIEICQELNRRYPDHPYGWYLASFLMKKTRRVREALHAIDQALQLDPQPRYRLHRAQCLLQLGDRAGVATEAAALKQVGFREATMHADAGTLLYEAGDHTGALQHYTRAIELDGKEAQYYFNRAAVHRYHGDVDAAERDFDAAIALRPDDHEAYNSRAHLRTQTSGRNHIEQLEHALSGCESATGRVQLCYALAKECEDVGAFDRSFAFLKQGADLKRRHMRYSVESDLGIIERIRRVYGPPMFDGHVEGSEDEAAIFVIGMPRTGTTLVERILDSHPLVRSAGELNEFAVELVRLASRLPGGRTESRLEFVDRTTAVDFRALGEAYLRATRPMRGTQPYFVDKLPFNFLYAGLIHLALPRARIVNLRRHPMDTCYAVYKQLFKDAYPFSYDLDELGRYYVAYDELMRHWDAVMPGVIHTVTYENLVADLEGEVRRLLAYCGLPWQDECLQFHRNERASTTASAVQVRQPIYDTSIGKWRHFASQLEPLRASLERAGIDTR